MAWNKTCLIDGAKVRKVHRFRGHGIYICPSCNAVMSYSEKQDKAGNTLYTVELSPNGIAEEKEEEKNGKGEKKCMG